MENKYAVMAKIVMPFNKIRETFDLSEALELCDRLNQFLGQHQVSEDITFSVEEVEEKDGS